METDYEKKYNEAMVVIRTLKAANSNNKELVDFIEYKYPFLKESDDEKIRKAIIFYIKSSKPDWEHYKDYSSWIEWLEKQEERKPEVIIPKFRAGDIITSSRNRDIKYLVKKVGVKNELDEYEYVVEDVTDTEYKGRQHSILIDKVDEWGVLVKQNTEDWSEEDEKNLSQIEIILKGDGIVYRNRNELVDWLKSLKPQPKQEWSEEDESMLTRCIGILGKCYMGQLPTKVEEELNWLKSLKPQSHQKPNQDELDKAANEWNRKASFSPIAMTLDSHGNPNGTKVYETTHADSFKAGVEWLIKRETEREQFY